MHEYEKIETLFDRNPDNMKKVILGQLRLPEFDLVTRWHVTEKLDGTNIRVIYYPTNPPIDGEVAILGRTENASLHPAYVDVIHKMLPFARFASVFPDINPTSTVTLYGEAYGPKVQSGGWYRDSPGFRVFDVRVDEWWLNWDNVVDVCEKLEVKTVPVLGENATTEEALDLVEQVSHTAALEGGDVSRVHEGIVARTDPLLFMRDGRRLMWKLKVRDLL